MLMSQTTENVNERLVLLVPWDENVTHKGDQGDVALVTAYVYAARVQVLHKN